MKPVSWDGNSINDLSNYVSAFPAEAYGLPDAGVRAAARESAWPVFTGLSRPGRIIPLDIYIVGASVDSLKTQLYQWFDPDDEISKTLIIESDTGGNNRYINGICRRLTTIGEPSGFHFVAEIVVDGDIRFRESSASTDTWTTTDTGLTHNITNNGEDYAYPVISITPTAAKSSGGFTYQRFIVADWQLDEGYINYPLDLCNGGLDTAALVTGGKMQADGDDLRAYVDGAEVPRWLQGENTTDTAVWVNLDFQARVAGTLRDAIGATDTVTSIYVTGGVDDFPYSGIVLIDSELFTYTSKFNFDNQLSGVTRAAYGTSAAAHTVTDAVIWIQHEILLSYGNSGATAPSTDNDIYKPIMTLASSSNILWDYDEFRDDDGLRSGIWTYEPQYLNVEYYGGNQGARLDPWGELGMHVEGGDLITEYIARVGLRNPCGMTNAFFSNGEKYGENITSLQPSDWVAEIRTLGGGGPGGSGWVTEDQIAAPTTDATWESWSDNEPLTSGSTEVELYFKIRGYGLTTAKNYYLEAADCAITLSSTDTPQITVGAEQTAYQLDCTITNNTTGKAIELSLTMTINETLEVDSDGKTITYLLNDTNQFQALGLVGGPRRDWLALAPGVNTLQFDDTGTTGVQLDFSWIERHYD